MKYFFFKEDLRKIQSSFSLENPFDLAGAKNTQKKSELCLQNSFQIRSFLQKKGKIFFLVFWNDKEEIFIPFFF